MKKLSLPLLQAEVFLFVGKEEIEYFKETVKESLQVEEYDFPHKSVDGVSTDRFVWIRSLTIDILTHEMIHQAVDILNSKGIPFSDFYGECIDCGTPKGKQDEILAYLVGYLVKNFYSDGHCYCDRISHVQEYECQEIIKKGEKFISVDKCLVKELKSLHEKGIETVGSCCGRHVNQKAEGYIQVDEESIDKMKKEGYKEIEKVLGAFKIKTEIV